MLWVCVCVYVCVFTHAQSCPTLCDPMDCSPPSSSVHEILQASILAWVASSSSRGSSWPRDQTHFSFISCMAGGFLTTSTKLGLGLKSVDPPKASPVAKTWANNCENGKQETQLCCPLSLALQTSGALDTQVPLKSLCHPSSPNPIDPFCLPAALILISTLSPCTAGQFPGKAGETLMRKEGATALWCYFANKGPSG